MIKLNIWRAIGDFCTNILFAPYDFFRNLNNEEHWWTANAFGIILFLIGAVLFIYWFKQLAKFKTTNTEDFVK